MIKHGTYPDGNVFHIDVAEADVCAGVTFIEGSYRVVCTARNVHEMGESESLRDCWPRAVVIVMLF